MSEEQQVLRLMALNSVAQNNPLATLAVLFGLQDIIANLESGNTAIPPEKRPEHLSEFYKLYAEGALVILSALEEAGASKDEVGAMAVLIDYHYHHSGWDMRHELERKLSAIKILTVAIESGNSNIPKSMQAELMSDMKGILKIGDEALKNYPKEPLH